MILALEAAIADGISGPEAAVCIAVIAGFCFWLWLLFR